MRERREKEIGNLNIMCRLKSIVKKLFTVFTDWESLESAGVLLSALSTVCITAAKCKKIIILDSIIHSWLIIGPQKFFETVLKEIDENKPKYKWYTYSSVEFYSVEWIFSAGSVLQNTESLGRLSCISFSFLVG